MARRPNGAGIAVNPPLPFDDAELDALGLVISQAPSEFFVCHEGDGRTSVTLTRESLTRLVAQAKMASALKAALGGMFILTVVALSVMAFIR